MKVSKTNIYVDDEDELMALELELEAWEKEWEGARWMFLNSEWAEYVQGKVRIKRQLRKVKERMGYNVT